MSGFDGSGIGMDSWGPLGGVERVILPEATADDVKYIAEKDTTSINIMIHNVRGDDFQFTSSMYQYRTACNMNLVIMS
jgi:hypothetical protein